MTGVSKSRNVVKCVGEETVILSEELPALSFDGKRTLLVSKVRVEVDLKLFSCLQIARG